jgi:hypothetical protein
MPARAVLALIREVVPSEDVGAAPAEPPAATWRERLWTAPAETRLGLKELSEAIGRPKSWIYKRTSQKGGLEQIPHRRLDGVLIFLAGEVRQMACAARARHRRLTIGGASVAAASSCGRAAALGYSVAGLQ